MLKLQNITKDYITAGSKVEALKGVSLEFRKSEFVAILGPSGCGKTTLLNIVGGLDKYTTGDLVINNKSTKNYTDYDWDTYRNHSVGFVFQSYNLIPHQTVLSNVELALTLSGVSKQERKTRAIDALTKVGLENQLNKKPNQLSGGQMQRVSIARAIVNDPEIILADEPTGALDTKTSLQVMDILKEIAKDRLVVMVTHNPTLANSYATRIINLTDGEVTHDSNPYDSSNDEIVEEIKPTLTKKELKKKTKQSSMSFWTAFSLSLNNLLTKKARTILTAFAGSIGIIGIALILSLSSGFQNYIDKVQEDTLSTYPITIEEQSVNYMEMMENMQGNKKDPIEHDLDKIYSNNILSELLKTVMQGVKKNDLQAFKAHLDNHPELKDYVSDVKYTYNANFDVYSPTYTDTENRRLVPTDFDVFSKFPPQMAPAIQMTMNSMNVWDEMLDNKQLIESQYELVGKNSRWPNSYNEVLVVVNERNEITDNILFSLGLKGEKDFQELLKHMYDPDYVAPITTYSYDDIIGLTYKLVLDSDYYKLENGVYTNIEKNKQLMKDVLDNSIDVKVVGIIRAKENVKATSITGAIAYSKELTEHIVDKNLSSDVIKAQLNSPLINVTTNKPFIKDSDGNVNKEDYKIALEKLGYSTLDCPKTISIYPISFEAKEKIKEIINEYNTDKPLKDQIQYTDYVDMMMSSVSVIIDSISYVLIAFVSISLVVSSIMIGIITYISVLERTKEIGVLRSIGARKKDISRVFNAETIIIGFFAGIFGILVTILLDIPINIILSHLADMDNVAKLPVIGSFILILISVLLTSIAGLIPSRLAAKKDPVIALRTE